MTMILSMTMTRMTGKIAPILSLGCIFLPKMRKNEKNDKKVAKMLDNRGTACYTVLEARACAQALGTSEACPESDPSRGMGNRYGSCALS